MSKDSSQDNLAQRTAELRSALKGKEPRILASRTATVFNDIGDGTGEFRFLYGDAVKRNAER